METIRQQKVAKIIQVEIADILQKEASTFGGFITVTKVNVTKDLSLARINLSIFGVTGKQEVLKKIKTASKEIRFKLGNSVKHQLRIVPNLDFFIDDSFDRAQRIEELLKS